MANVEHLEWNLERVANGWVICELAEWVEEESTTATLTAVTTPKIKLEKEAMSAENVFDEMIIRDEEVKMGAYNVICGGNIVLDNPPPKVIVPSPLRGYDDPKLNLIDKGSLYCITDSVPVIFDPGIFLDKSMILIEWKFHEVALFKNSEHMAAIIGNVISVEILDFIMEGGMRGRIIMKSSVTHSSSAHTDDRKKDISQRVKVRSHHFRFLGGIGHEVGSLWQISQQLRCGLVAEQTFENLNFSTSAYQANQILNQSDPCVAFVLFNWLKIKVGFKHDGHKYITMMGILGRAEQFGLINRLLDQVLKDKCHSTVVICNCLIHSYGCTNYLNNQSPKQQRKGNKDLVDNILKTPRRGVNVLLHADMASRVIDHLEDSFSHHGKKGEVLLMKLDIQRILQNYEQQQQFEFQQLPTSYLQLAIHRVAQYYGLVTMVLDNGLEESKIMAKKTNQVLSKKYSVVVQFSPTKEKFLIATGDIVIKV
ncbi:hypothetical protein V6N11_080918 [Hibiscus sabdariffa]|uniref:Uncharacterized protein n=1 Tax=Hibiscus sabdariffa TaxID=183260 RepID=A0ABR2QIB7_9ROSI